MGMVYRAQDRMLEETVALKVLRPDIAQSPEVARRFRSEIKLARKVTHPNVCRIHDYGEDGSLGYIAMEIVEGTDLKQLRTRQGPLSIGQAYEVTVQLAEGLQAIHDAGVMHRDLKTSNVMLDVHGRIKLMDFGIAKEMGGATLGATAMGHVVGTPEYMSPEQARGHKLDFRSDVYSLGIVIYEIFTGHVPFRGDTPIATIYLNLEQPPPLEGPDAAGIPPALVPVLARALAKDPRDRYGSPREVAQALRSARAQSLPSGAAVALPSAPPAPDATGTTDLRAPVRGATPAPPPTVAGAAPTVSAATPPPLPASRRQLATPTPTSPPLPARVADEPAAKPQPSRSVLPWLLLGAGLLAVAAGSLFLLVKQFLDGPDAGDVTAVSLTPERRTTTTIPAATTTTSVTTSSTSTTATTSTTTSTLPTTVAPRAAAEAAAATGLLQIVVRPWAEVSVDDHVVGTTPLQPLVLKPGPHTVRLTHPSYQPLQRRLTIEPGRTFRLEVDLRQDAVAKPRP